MYAVSLLPREYKQTRSATRRGRLLLMIGIVTIAVLVVALIILNLIGTSLNQELDALKMGNEVMMQHIDALKPVENLLNEVSALTAQVTQVMGYYPEWGTIIPDIGNALPPDVFLTNLTASYTGGEGIIIVLGRAPHHETVSGLISNLADIDGFGEITCAFATVDSASSNVQFELSIPMGVGIEQQLEGSGQ